MERTTEQWKKEIAEDQHLVRYYVARALVAEEGDNPIQMWAMALKEARRMESDLYRMAAVHGITREQIDSTRNL